ncbi:MAG: hypothetical protein PHG81_13565 [Aliarcobacter sp.]|nr:hypothetical protein [Aliarcobacter sp.]
MKKNILVISILAASVLFTGCAVKTGNEKLQEVTNENIDSVIKNGVSTKTEVKSKLGGPGKIDFLNNGLEKWEYDHTLRVEKGVNYVPVVNWFVKGTNDTKKSLVILFDGDIVKTHTFSSENGETMGGLVR